MKKKLKIALIVAAGLALVALYGFYALTMKNRVVEGTVIEKYTKVVKGQDKYFVVVEHDGRREVFESTDSWLNLKWDSADVWANAVAGKRFRLEVVGLRSGFLSYNRNIVALTPASEGGK